MSTLVKHISFYPFEELVGKLREHNLNEPADYFAELMQSPCTTSSELVGELGLAIIRFQHEHSAIPYDVQYILDQCLKEVRIVWPDMK